MKDQSVDIERSPLDYSIGQRPIHETYEPPNPIPQFRPRPKLHQSQVPTRRPAYPTITKKSAQATPSAASTDLQTADSEKSS